MDYPDGIRKWGDTSLHRADYLNVACSGITRTEQYPKWSSDNACTFVLLLWISHCISCGMMWCYPFDWFAQSCIRISTQDRLSFESSFTSITISALWFRELRDIHHWDSITGAPGNWQAGKRIILAKRSLLFVRRCGSTNINIPGMSYISFSTKINRL